MPDVSAEQSDKPVSVSALLSDAEALAAYDLIAREFIAKVDRGEAYSRHTYAALKSVLERRPEILIRSEKADPS